MRDNKEILQDYNIEIQNLENIVNNSSQSKAIEIPITKTIFSLLNVDNKQLPERLVKQFEQIENIIKNNQTTIDLYSKELAEIPFSTSQYQDVCVQMEQHFTPHRKLRQAIMELDSRLRALYAAKDNFIETYYKLEELKIKKEKLLYEIENDDKLSSFDKEIKKIKLEKLEYDIQKYERELKLIINLIKDAMLKVAMYQSLIDQYKKEVEESGLSFEESEVIYYVMYFTKDAEVQLRTMGRVDTGTMGAITQLPEIIRRRVLQNIQFIAEKLQMGEGKDEYLFIKYKDELLPKKTGENEFDGFNIKEFIGTDIIKLLALPTSNNNDFIQNNDNTNK